MSDNLRRSTPLFPISIVMSLTELTARQIRYYEEHQLITPARTEGNRRLFSFNDVDRLLEVKKLIEKGLNLAGIKEVLGVNNKADASKTNDAVAKPTLSDSELRKILRDELNEAGRLNKASLRQGDISSFFKNKRY